MFSKIKWPWKKRKSVSPVDTFCRNCDVRIIGRFCHKCGQDSITNVGLPIFEFIKQFLDRTFAINGKTPATLANLMWRPGFLSTQFRVGRIVRYVHPVKLFWFATLVFFALMISQITLVDVDINEDGSISGNLLVPKEREQVAEPATLEQEIEQLERAKQELIARQSKSTEKNITITAGGQRIEPEQAARYFSRYGPFVAFSLIPFFALLLVLFFWKNRFYYMYHLVFALHFHTFLWVFFSLLILFNMIFPKVSFPNWLSFLLAIAPGIYLSIAMRRFYQTTRLKAIWKAIVAMILYFFLIILVMSLVGYLVLWIMKL